MSIRMLIDASHQEETRVAIVDGNRVEEFDYESSARKQIKGSIYLAKITRVEPSLQAAFVDYGGNRHGFLAFSEIHPDYYQIPVSDREALIAQEAAANADLLNDDDDDDDDDSARKPDEADAKTISEATTDKIKEDKSHDDDLIAKDGEKNKEEDQKDEKSADTDDASNDDDASEENTDDDEDEEEKLRIKMAKRLRYKYKIQEVIKKNQIILIQVVKEERGNKGAALTTYLSLPGRYCVLMPNSLHGGGVSRKIANVKDRKKLKNMLNSFNMPKGHACIIRTAGNNRTKPEIKRDYDYLKRMWEAIRELTLKSIAPAMIYEEGDLIKRSIRDLYTRDISEILVEGVRGYNTAKNFMQMLMPSHAKKIIEYDDPVPLFQRYQVENHLDSMYSPTAQLKSGGYIVINPTEALVSIDVNSGRATKEHNIEETAVKTNIEAAEEIARQLKLRDMAGLVVIDFIDMEDNRNNRAVERKMKSCLKSDRARIQVGRISSFGLMEMSRQRLRVGVLESSTTACPHCEGSGLLRTVESQSLHILRVIEEEGIRATNSIFTVYLPSNVAVYILNNKRHSLIDLEKRYEFSVTIAIDNDLTASAYKMEKAGKPSKKSLMSKDSLKLGKDINTLIDVTEEDVSPATDNDNSKDRPKRRRRRRRNQYNRNTDDNFQQKDTLDKKDGSENNNDEASEKTESNKDQDGQERGRRRRRPRRNRGRNQENDASKTENNDQAENIDVKEDVKEDVNKEVKSSAEADDKQVEATKPEEKPKRKPRKARVKAADKEEKPAKDDTQEKQVTEEKPKRARKRTTAKKEAPKKDTSKKDEGEKTSDKKTSPKAKPASVDKEKPVKAENPKESKPTEDKPKKKGWWSRVTQ